MSTRIPATKNASSLPEQFGEPEWVNDVIDVGGITMYRAGVAVTTEAGETITGSAADIVAAPTKSRAHYELLERMATLEAIASGLTRSLSTLRNENLGEVTSEELFPVSPDPARFRYARSNGVAIHQSFRRAALRARWELAERDRVLRSWCGLACPTRLAIDPALSARRGSALHDWQAYDLGRAAFAPEADVVCVVGFPCHDGDPLALGFAARPGVRQATESAMMEAMQSLSFLWGEPLPRAAPVLGPTPHHHLEMFQYPPHHDRLRIWFAGGRRQDAALPEIPGEVRYVSLTPTWIARGLAVVKAVCAEAIPLAFGDVPFLRSTGVSAQAHPVA